MQSDYQTQTCSDFLFSHNRTQTPLECCFWTEKRILRPIRLVKEPVALVRSDFYIFEIVSYEKTKTPEVFTIESAYAQHQRPCY